MSCWPTEAEVALVVQGDENHSSFLRVCVRGELSSAESAPQWSPQRCVVQKCVVAQRKDVLLLQSVRPNTVMFSPVAVIYTEPEPSPSITQCVLVIMTGGVGGGCSGG